MKRISHIVLFDYLYYSVGLFFFIVLFMPFQTQEFFEKYSVLASLLYCIPVIPAFFTDFLICEMIATYIFMKPSDYSQPMRYQIQRTAAIAIPCIILNAVFNLQYFQIIQYGLEQWNVWIDGNGSFTLDCYWQDLKESILVGVLMISIYLFQTYNRMQKYQIEELQALNLMLDAEQKMLRSILSKDNVTDKIIIHGDSRESLIVNPLDIMYVESVGNYLNIVYFDDSDICQKRLRSSLKDVEETLEAFPFMVHTHRAFLVNINFITQVAGNTAGYKISLFSTDKTLPVSKANVPLFRDKVKELGKNLK